MSVYGNFWCHTFSIQHSPPLCICLSQRGDTDDVRTRFVFFSYHNMLSPLIDNGFYHSEDFSRFSHFLFHFVLFSFLISHSQSRKRRNRKQCIVKSWLSIFHRFDGWFHSQKTNGLEEIVKIVLMNSMGSICFTSFVGLSAERQLAEVWAVRTIRWAWKIGNDTWSMHGVRNSQHKKTTGFIAGQQSTLCIQNALLLFPHFLFSLPLSFRQICQAFIFATAATDYTVLAS